MRPPKLKPGFEAEGEAGGFDGTSQHESPAESATRRPDHSSVSNCLLNSWIWLSAVSLLFPAPLALTPRRLPSAGIAQRCHLNGKLNS
jgi:hypothetical protein